MNAARPRFQTVARLATLAFAVMALAACDRMVTPQNTQKAKDADARVAQGEFLEAVRLYESALDDSARAADIHYKLGLLYDGKMNDPLNAMHHFKRYLALQPAGNRAREVKEFIKRDEITLLTSLSGDSIVPRAEAVRLKNENLNLRQQLEERSARLRPVEEKAARPVPAEKSAPATAGDKTYVVKYGDTLFSISRKFYKSPSRWKQIRDANKETVSSQGKLRPGQTLVIP